MIACPSCGHVPPYCDACVSATVGTMAGHARSRGMRWAEQVAAKVPPASREWPAYEGRCADIARRLVADLCWDERVAEQLAVACYEDARRWRERRRG